jgi:O-Antigen ligase
LNKQVLIVFLVIAGFISALIWTVPGVEVNVNFGQLLGILFGGCLLVRGVVNNYEIPLVFKDWPSFFIYAYLGSNIFSSVFFSSDSMKALKSCMAIAVYVNIYHIARWLIQAANSSAQTVQFMKITNLASALFGLVCMIMSILLGGWENIGVSLGHIGEDTPSIRSLCYEPNVFAIITSMVLCFNIAAYAQGQQKTLKDLLFIVIIAVCVLFSYTRSAYVTLTLATLIILLLSKKLTSRTFGYLSFAVLTVLLLGGLLSEDNFLKQAVLNRTANIGNFEEGSGLGRVASYIIGFNGFLQKPIFGNGSMSADTGDINAITGEIQHVMGSAGWLSSSLVQSLHDTGLFGAAMVLGIFISLIRTNYSYFRTAKNQPDKSILLGFLGGNIIILVASQITSVFWIAFPFVYWASNMAFISGLKKINHSVNVDKAAV